MKNKRKRVLCVLLAVVCVVQLLLVFAITAVAAGETASTSGVLDDLKRDPKFNEADYPQNPDDHSVQVIQVAEGANGELFLYVYRPEGTDNADHRARYINMSTVNPVELSSDVFSDNALNELYPLTWLSASGTLEKYQVNNFTVSSNEDRYYNIAAVYRPFDENCDTKEDKSWDDITGFKGFEVGLCWHFYYFNDRLIIEAAEVRVVDVEILTVGFIGYNDGLSWSGANKTDVHYVGFSVKNYNVDYIYDADVSYFYQSKEEVWIDKIEINLGELQGPKKVYISDNDTAENDGSGWFGYKYKWKKIVTLQEFKDQIDFAKNEDSWIENNILDGSFDNVQYVFQFLETERVAVRPSDPFDYGYSYKCTSTYVSNVGVLRLHFKTPKGTYNLGVVSDLVSDDGIEDIVISIADNVEHMWQDFTEWFEKILSVILIILFVVIFWPIVTPIFNILFKIIGLGVKIVWKAIWYVLTLPLKLCKWILFPKKE